MLFRNFSCRPSARNPKVHERRDHMLAMTAGIDVRERRIDHHTAAALDAGERRVDNLAPIIMSVMIMPIVAMIHPRIVLDFDNCGL
jgi:hypothetical protein